MIEDKKWRNRHKATIEEKEKDTIRKLILNEGNNIMYSVLILKYQDIPGKSREVFDILMESMVKKGEIFEPELGRIGVVN